jgi:hypothetical protein
MKRILISEDDRSRILNMHTSHRLINEAYTGSKNEGYDTIEACKKDIPYNVVTKARLNWNTVKQAWGSKGIDTENIALRNAFCDGWRPNDPKPGTTGTTGTGTTGTGTTGTGTTGTGTTGTGTTGTGGQPQFKETYTEPTFPTPKAD